MPKRVLPLTDAQIKNAKPRERAYKLFDGEGLYLEVAPTGAKGWRLKYRYGGREKRISLGVYPEVSLREARDERQKMKALLREGIDPAADRRRKKLEEREKGETTFEAAARRWFKKKMGAKSESHRTRIWQIIERDLFPFLGPRPLATIHAQDILGAARRIEKRGALETAHRAIQVSSQIFRYAVSEGLGQVDSDPTQSIAKDALPPVKHRHMAAPADDPAKVGEILRMLEAYRGSPVVRAALLLLPYVFCRPGELRRMRWEEVDLDSSEWRYVATKTETRHLVPLSRQAIDILEELRPLTGHLPGGWVFPGGRTPLRHLSETAINAAYKRLGIDTRNELTPHGWRAVARTFLHERLGYRPEVIEVQLAHEVKDPNGRAYNRAMFLDQRREMMQVWADYLDGLKAGEAAKVVSIAAGK